MALPPIVQPCALERENLMSSDSQDFVFEVDWGGVPAPEPPPPSAATPTEPPPFAPTTGAVALPLSEPPPIPTLAPSTAPPPLATVARAPVAPPPIAPAAPAAPVAPARAVIRGQRVTLSELGIQGDEFRIAVQISHTAGEPLDLTCLGLDAQSRLSDERYFIFYNQPASPCGGLSLLGPGGTFQQVFGVKLRLLPTLIERLAIVAAFESGGTMAGLCASRVALVNGRAANPRPVHEAENPVAEFAFTGNDFGTERAMIIAEIYRRDATWRFAAAGQGFGGGLAALLRHYGAQVSD